MAKIQWWSKHYDLDGRTYYFRRETNGYAHRISKQEWEDHLKYKENDKSPKYWAVGTVGADGRAKWVYSHRLPGNKNVYEIDPPNFYNNVGYDPAAMDRILHVVRKHKALLVQNNNDHSMDIPVGVVYTLKSNINTFTVPTISVNEMQTRAAFGMPFTSVILTPLDQIVLPVLSKNRRACVKKGSNILEKSKLLGETPELYEVCRFNKNDCNYALNIIVADKASEEGRSKLYNNSTLSSLFLPKLDHWVCDENAYWLLSIKGYEEAKDGDINEAETKRIVGTAKANGLFLGTEFKMNDFMVNTKDRRKVVFKIPKSGMYLKQDESKSLPLASTTVVKTSANAVDMNWQDLENKMDSNDYLKIG